MATLLDRLNRELEAFGRRAQAAIDEGKLQIELMRLRRKQANAARDLGMLVHRRERGGEADAARYDALLLKLDDLEREIARMEREIAATREESVTVKSEPAPTSASSTPAESTLADAEPVAGTGEQQQPV